MVSMEQALAVTLPLDRLPLARHREALNRLVDGGYRHVFTGEVNGCDALAPLLFFGSQRDEIGLVSGIVNVFTRGPALVAMQAASLAEAFPGRVTFGMGASSNVIVEQWNGIPYERPFTRVAETLRFVRECVGGQEPSGDYSTIHSRGFRLGRVPEVPPELAIAALGPRMLKLAAEEADAVILNYLSAKDVQFVRNELSAITRASNTPLRICVRVFVFPELEAGAADIAARRAITGYLTVPVYRRFQQWLGRTDELAEMWDAWARGDRKAAVQAIPSQTVDDLMIHGDAASCARAAQEYVAAGADQVTIRLLDPRGGALDPTEQLEFLEQLAFHFKE